MEINRVYLEIKQIHTDTKIRGEYTHRYIHMNIHTCMHACIYIYSLYTYDDHDNMDAQKEQYFCMCWRRCFFVFVASPDPGVAVLQTSYHMDSQSYL